MAIVTHEKKSYYYANVGKEGRMRLRNRQEDGKYLEQFVDGISGNIVKIEKTEGDFEGQPVPRLSITVQDGEERYVLSVSRYANYGRGLINKLHNVNLNKKVEIGVFTSQFDGKTYVHATIKQSDKNVAAKWTKEEIPAVKTVKVGKKDVMDSQARDDWFDAKLDELITDMKEKPAPTAYDEVFEEETADVPF
jgi:hypothetical protein